MKKIILSLALVSLVACSKSGDERLAKQADIQVQEEIRAQNQNQRDWAERMEVDLNERKKFIEAIEGNFSGELDMLNMEFLMKVEFVPSIPIDYPNRVRTLEEINFELQNLSLNIHIKLENPRVPNSAVSCVVNNYRPDVKNGLINIISESCRNVFQFTISDNSNIPDSGEGRGRGARDLSRDIRNGNLTRVEFIEGHLETSVSSVKHFFRLSR